MSAHSTPQLSEAEQADAAARLERAKAAGCPIVNFDYTTRKPAMTYFNEFDKLRNQASTAYSTYGPGFWMLLTSDLVREAYQTPEIFSSSATIPSVPNPDWHWIPTMVDPPLHSEYRRMLNIAFSPRFVKQNEDRIRQDCIETIEKFAGDGKVDFIEQFAKVFPTQVFLRIVGLPMEHTEMFMAWVEATFDGLGHLGDDAMNQREAQIAIQAYFAEVLKDRRENPPANAEDDFFSILASTVIGGEPITDEAFTNMAEVILLAGLDTVKSQLSYMFYWLANNPSDREWIVREPEIIPNAVEEFLRAHNIVMTARQVAQDTDFHGCPMKKGDMVMVANPSASRDEAEFDNPTEIQFDRQITTHYSFAGGPHRCVGAHLVRTELAVALEEWHKRIPNYTVTNTEGLVEAGPTVGLERLELGWPV
ncbi:cytochrome P450 [Rhodococcus rhodochrous]|uniref:Cytochrome P450 n=1 Tax=Rhodococcus rhodochrous TaxID=1829 RepID=A0AAW4XP19_RHORH|nr:cytochrome P450 [Rhodococcus rhodochrous]MCD2114626.1 cytochrome P450 [Rhodococcus rhodochrous]